MAAEKGKKSAGDKAKKPSGQKPTGQKPGKPGDDKPKKKPKEKAAVEAAAPEAPKPVEERKPADPRLKYMKKMKGRFLPKGALRDRHQEVLARWNADENHGGVTVEELRSLFEDWRVTRQKPVGSRAK